MTSFAIAADLHLGSGQALSSDRAADQERTLNELADHLATEQVDTLLLAGDIFHRPRPTPETLLIFRRFTRRLEALGIPMIAITGNAGHDIENGDRPCALELFESDWLRVSRTPELIRAAGDVAVCTLPSVPISRLVATQNGGDRAETFELAADLLVEAAKELRAQVPDGWPSILLGHWSVSGASLPNGLPVTDLNETVLPLALMDIGFDASVFGHIHRRQVLTERPFIAYTGSPHVVDFGEANVEHGFWILDVDETGVRDELYLPLGDRRFVTVDVDLAEPGATFPERALDELDETDLVAAAIATQLPLEGSVVRLRYRATEEQHRRVDRQALLGFLAEAGADKVHGPSWEPVRTSRARAEVNGDGLSDHDALDLWLRAQGVEPGEGRHGNLHALLDRLEAVEA